MGAAWFQFRVGLRSRWRAWSAIAILAGFVAGAAMVAVAGARRTDSSLHRVVVANRAPDLFVGFNNGLMTPEILAGLKAQPQVAEYEYQVAPVMFPLKNGKPDLAAASNTIVLGNPDGHTLHSIDRPGIVAGRIPSPDELHSIVVNEKAARIGHLHVGSRLPVGFAGVTDLERFDGSEATMPKLHKMVLTVVGIVRPFDDAIRAADDPRRSPVFLLTRALTQRIAKLGGFYDGFQVRLHDPDQVPAYKAAVRRAAGENVLDIQELRGTLERARRATRPYVLALWFFAALALLAGGAVVAQVMTRQRRIEASSREALRALGATRADFVRAATLRGLFVGVLAAAVAVLVATIGSVLMPIGPLVILEPNRGIDLDLTVLLISAVVVVLLITLYTALGALRRPPRARHGRHRLNDAIAASGVPPTVSTGVRNALDPGRGDAAIPVLSTVFGVGLAIAALVATLVFASSLTNFTSTPRLYGWIWSYQAEMNGERTVADLEHDLAQLTADPHVRRAAVGAYAQLAIEGKTVGSVAIAHKRGVPITEVLSGRAPRRASEIALGSTTLHTLHRKVGDAIPVRIGAIEHPMRIVGRAVFPRFAPYPSSEPTGLGVGAVMTLDALRRFGPLNDSPQSPVAASPFILLDARPGTRASTLAKLVFDNDPTEGMVLAAQRPNEVSSYEHLERTPFFLVGLLVLLAIATLAHLLVSAVRRRRRELGSLRALGFTASQLRVSVLVQATTLIALSLLVAIPLGIVAGRVLWSITARWLGIPMEVVTPGTEIALVALGALVVGNLAALVPAVSVGRVDPAEILGPSEERVYGPRSGPSATIDPFRKRLLCGVAPDASRSSCPKTVS